MAKTYGDRVNEIATTRLLPFITETPEHPSVIAERAGLTLGQTVGFAMGLMYAGVLVRVGNDFARA